MTPEEVAAGALEIAAANQVFGIRQVTTTRGREPGDYAMVAFGGAGGLFATEVADFLGITTVISPPDPGNLCAFGLHVSDVAPRLHPHHRAPAVGAPTPARSSPPGTRLPTTGLADIDGRGHRRGRASRSAASPTSAISARATRCRSTFPPGSTDEAAVAHMWKEFHKVHDRTFGFHYEGEQDVELVNLRIQAVGEQHRPSLSSRTRPRDAAGEPFATPPGLLARRPAGSTCPLYRRTRARPRPGHRRAGDHRGIRLDGRGAAAAGRVPRRRLRQSHPRKDAGSTT